MKQCVQVFIIGKQHKNFFKKTKLKGKKINSEYAHYKNNIQEFNFIRMYTNINISLGLQPLL